MEMGFSRDKVQRALKREEIDLEQATNFLVNQPDVYVGEPDDEDDIEAGSMSGGSRPDLLPAANILESSQHPPSIRASDSFHSEAAMGIPVIPNAPLIYANPAVPFPVIPTNTPLIYANPSVPTAEQILGGGEGDGDADQDLLEGVKAASLLSLDTPQPAMDDKVIDDKVILHLSLSYIHVLQVSHETY